jgi:Holliday junction resolvase RusA-like endonuclease
MDVFAAEEKGRPTRLAFSVAMTPQPQGSARAFVVKGHAVVTSDNKRLKDYRQAVAWSAQACRPRGWRPLDGPVLVSVVFMLLKPRSVPKRRRLPTVKPDVDKLARAVLDALTGIAYRDDAQVTTLSVRKEYGDFAATTVTVMEDA